MVYKMLLYSIRIDTDTEDTKYRGTIRIYKYKYAQVKCSQTLSTNRSL